MCLSKEDGRLGFRTLKALIKLCWPSKLGGCFNTPLASYAWRSILHGRDFLTKGLRQEVGNGNSLSVWMDPWLYDNGHRLPLQRHFSVNLNLRVKDLINFGDRCWRRDLLEDLFFQADVDLICKRNPVVDLDDYWVWLHSKTGEYSVKSGYWLAFHINKPDLIQEATQNPSTNALKEKI